MPRLPTLAGTLVGAAVIAWVATACGGSSTAAPPSTGSAIYKAYCATCHGLNGQGFVGPRLAGVVASKYPDVADQIAVVTNGRGEMPAWGGQLSEQQIRTVVGYTRTGLGS